MRGILKGFLAGAVMMVIGLSMFLIGLALDNWSLSPDFEEKRVAVSSEGVNEIVISANAGDIRLEPYEGGNIVAYFPVSRLYSVNISKSGGAVRYNARYRQWSNLFGYNIPEAVIYLPKSMTFDLSVTVQATHVEIAGGKFGEVGLNASAGVINVTDGLICDSLNAKITAGGITVASAECASAAFELWAGYARADRLACGNISAGVTAGAAEFSVDGRRGDYNMDVKYTLGSCNVDSREGSDPGKMIKINVSTGTVNVWFNR